MASENQGCLGFLFRLFNSSSGVAAALPYRLEDRFLTKAELSFFHVLRSAVGSRAYICCKVSLGDIFSVESKEGKVSFRNKIDRKHVDFLLCDTHTIQPLAGVELGACLGNGPLEESSGPLSNV